MAVSFVLLVCSVPRSVPPCRREKVVVVADHTNHLAFIHWKFDFPQFFSTEEKIGKLSLVKLSLVFHATVE